MVKERRKGNLSNRVIDIDFLRKMSSDDVLGMMKQSKLYKAGVSYALEIK
jgi:hypothetical protein